MDLRRMSSFVLPVAVAVAVPQTLVGGLVFSCVSKIVCTIGGGWGVGG